MNETDIMVRELNRRGICRAEGESAGKAMEPVEIVILEEMLGDPLPGELTYDEAAPDARLWGRDIDRLMALSLLRKACDDGLVKLDDEHEGINTHVHTNASFSVFRSPAEAVWHAYRKGLRVFGINDHYTIAGHAEFGWACSLLGLKPIYSIEAVALDADAQAEGVRFNDPANPGRIYLGGKGVVRNLTTGSEEDAFLKGMLQALEERNRLIVSKVSALIAQINPEIILNFEDVLHLTPAGNVTERHIAQAIDEAAERFYGSTDERDTFLSELLDIDDSKLPAAEAARQNIIRDKLLKTGRPAFVAESPDAFLPLQDMIRLFRAYGAIPTYPVLGNPHTEAEDDWDNLFAHLKRRGIFAAEVIPNRNDRERLQAILAAAARADMPLFNGTEHNTREMLPMLDKFALEKPFSDVFADGAAVLLAHQLLSSEGKPGYLDECGQPSIDGDPAATLKYYREKGRSIMRG